MTIIQTQDGDILFKDGSVAGSEKCRCRCDSECLSITFAGFGPPGDPCNECDALNGTYVLHKRPIVRPWGWGPWTYTYCGNGNCPPPEDGDYACLEIVVVLGCEEHSLVVSTNGTVIFSAETPNEGQPCEETVFTGGSGGGCAQAGTATLAEAECDTPPDVRCCECPPCGEPTEWAIVDITTGWDVLASGPIWYEGSLYGIPTPVRTRCWKTPQMPAVITMGLFVYSYPAQNPAECAVYKAIEIWQTYPKKCSGGKWWTEHTWKATYPGIDCKNPPTPLRTDLPTASFPTLSTAFWGNPDCEWTNMSNWSNPALGQYLQAACNDRDLPDENVGVEVWGNLLGNALGTATAKTLLIGPNVKFGITISVKETADIQGTVVRACGGTVTAKCALPPEFGCCNPQGAGNISAEGDVTLSGTNSGVIFGKSASVTGQNIGGLISVSGSGEGVGITFSSSSKNAGFLQGPKITFKDTSTNYDPDVWRDCPWVEHLTPRVQGEVTFRDQSVNHGSSFSDFVVSFEDDSSHAAGASTQSACSFYDNAVNYGEVGSGSEFTYTSGTGSPSNATSGVVAGFASFSAADNYGVVEGNAAFPDGGRNWGVVEGNGDFTQNGENQTGGVVKGNAKFGGQPGVGGQFSGWNLGTVWGDAAFSSDTANYGTVRGNATFGGNAVNFGTVMGNATFNGNSSNLGTVLGTITCNTTGTC